MAGRCLFIDGAASVVFVGLAVPVRRSSVGVSGHGC